MFLIFYIPVSVAILAILFATLSVSRVQLSIQKKQKEFLSCHLDVALLKHFHKRANVTKSKKLATMSDDGNSYDPAADEESPEEILVDRFAFVFGILMELKLVDSCDVQPLLAVCRCRVTFAHSRLLTFFTSRFIVFSVLCPVSLAL